MNWKEEKTKRLVKAFLSLKDETECQAFLRDIMTESEINEFGNRLETARLLSAGVSYIVIEKKLGLSSTTVARVAKWLHGEGGGYKNILMKLYEK